MDKYLLKQSVFGDFHGILNIIFDYMENTYGEQETRNILKTIIREIYSPIIKDLKNFGLKTINDHINQVMNLENGDYSVEGNNSDKLTVTVNKCPAIRYMINNNINIYNNFCKFSTELLNNVITDESGYVFSVKYNQNKGNCIQKFWRRKNDIC